MHLDPYLYHHHRTRIICESRSLSSAPFSSFFPQSQHPIVAWTLQYLWWQVSPRGGARNQWLWFVSPFFCFVFFSLNLSGTGTVFSRVHKVAGKKWQSSWNR